MVEPKMSGRKLNRVTCTIVMEEDTEERHSTLVAADCQKKALHIADEEAAAQWAQALERLSPSELKFAINACQGTLSHNANLALWKGYPATANSVERGKHCYMSCATALWPYSSGGTMPDMTRCFTPSTTSSNSTSTPTSPSLLTSQSFLPSYSLLTLLKQTYDRTL